MSQHASTLDAVLTAPATGKRPVPAHRARRSPQGHRPWHRQENTWAILIGLGLALAANLLFLIDGNHVLHAVTVRFAPWETLAQLPSALGPALPSLIYLYALLLIPLSIGAARIGIPLRDFSKGLLPLFVLAVTITALSSHSALQAARLDTPLLALVIGLLLGNSLPLPAWLQTALRSGYYLKTGLVLMAALWLMTPLVALLPAAEGALYRADAGTALAALRDWFFTLGLLALGLNTRIAAFGAARAGTDALLRHAAGRTAVIVLLGYYLAQPLDRLL